MTDASSTAGKLAQLQEHLAETEYPGGEAAAEARHEAGGLTAREQIEHLVDNDSFVEFDALAKHRVADHGLDANRPATDGVVTGYATIEGRKVCVIAQDGTVFSGRLGEVYGEKMVKVYQLAARTGVPLITFLEGAGPRAAEGIAALSFYAKIVAHQAQSSGLVPQIAVVTGELIGPHALLASLADVVVMVAGSGAMSLTPPHVIQHATGEPTSAADFGASAQYEASGTAHVVVDDHEQAITTVAKLLGYLPANNRAEAPRVLEAKITGPVAEQMTERDKELDTLIPDSADTAYDMHEVINRVLDDSPLVELQAGYATNLITGFGRIEGRSVGVVANQPLELSGRLTGAAAEKAARFIRICDSFNIPVVTFVDVPGFLPDPAEELDGVVRRTGKLLSAYAEAQVGTVTVVTRKAMGAAAVAMGSKDLGADLLFAWPTAEIAALNAEDAVPEIHAAELAKAKRRKKDVEAMTAGFVEEYNEAHLSPYLAAERGLVDAVIPPHDTRGQLVEGLRLLERKVLYPAPKKHSNTPM